MSSKVTTLIFYFSILGSSIFAQEIWSLEKCIAQAQNNSLTVKRSQMNVSQAELTKKGSKLERLPSINASVSAGYQFGRTIDPSTNEFESRSIATNSISVDASVVLFGGNRINNNIKQAKLDLAAGKADLEDANLTIAINVAAAYLNVLFAEDQLTNANNRLSQTNDQLSQTDRLIQAGTLPQTERLQILAQQATDEQMVITQENNVEINYLNLKNLLELAPDYDMKLEHPDVAIPEETPEAFTFKDVYGQALKNQPIIRANDFRMSSALLEEKIAKAGMLPTLSAFGSMRTNAASKSLDFNNPNTDNVQLELGPVRPFQVGGVDVGVAEYKAVGIEYPERAYTDQLSDNFGQSVGLRLSLPIYNNSRNTIAVQRARLNVINTEITNEQTKQQLRADVMRAITDAKAAKKQLDASEKSLAAQEANFSNNEKRFKLGAINTFEFTSSKNQLDQAKVDYTINKYDYLYKLKIVDFYRGEKITLK